MTLLRPYYWYKSDFMHRTFGKEPRGAYWLAARVADKVHTDAIRQELVWRK